MARAPRIDAAVAEAGRRVLARHGYHAATVERIAREAGVSRVTLHRHGVSKDAILAVLLERALDDYRAAMWPALTRSGTGADRLESAQVALCEQAEANLELLLALRSRTDAVFHESGQEAMTRSVFTDPSSDCCRTESPTAPCAGSTRPSWPPCCSTSSAGRTSICAPDTGGTRPVPAGTCSTSRSTG